MAHEFRTINLIRSEFQYFAKVLSVLRYTLNIFKVSLNLSLKSVLKNLASSLANSIAKSLTKSLPKIVANLAKSLAKNLASLGRSLGSDPIPHQDSFEDSLPSFFSATI